MSTTAATGFCRVTIAAPDSRIDMALPEDIPLADLSPEILRLAGHAPLAGGPVGYSVVRRDGSVLDGARTLAAQRVLDGEVLALRPFADSLPPPVHDDVTDAVAEAVTQDRRLWDDQLLRVAGLTGASLLAALTAVALWFAEPVRHDMHGLPGIIAGALALFLTALAMVRVRVYEDRGAAAALGLGALPHALVAGSGALPLAADHGVGRLELLLGCATVLLFSLALAAAMPDSAAPFAATATAAGCGLLAAFGAITTEASPAVTAAVCAPVALGALAFLPGVSARLVRLPIGYTAPPVGFDAPNPDQLSGADAVADDARIADRARRGHQLLLGLAAGCALLATLSVGILGFAGDGWGRLLALATCLALITRASLFRYAVQVATLLTAGLVSLSLLVLGYSLAHSGEASDLRTVWLAVALTTGAAVMAAVALIVPRAGLAPFWGRVLDLGESMVLLSLVPLSLAVLGVYAEVRGLTSS